MSGLNELAHCNWTAILTGSFISAVIGYLCIKYFLIFISKNKLNIFAFYCWIVGLAMIVFFGIH